MEIINNVTPLPIKSVEPEKIQTLIKEGQYMESDELVSRRELETVKENIELKIQNAIQPLEGKIDNIQTNIDGKFETLEQKIEKMFLKQEQEIRKERQENIKWFVGTAIAIAASVAAMVSIL